MTILVGADGSGGAQRALEWAVGVSRAVGEARLVVAEVYVPDTARPRSRGDGRDRARRVLERRCQPARDAGIPYEAVLLDGDVGPSLMAAATERQARLTVVGRRGRSGWDALTIGSTTDFLAHHTRRALAVVPPEGGVSPPSHILLALDGSAGAAAAATLVASEAAPSAPKVTAAYVPVMPEVLGRLTDAQRKKAEGALSGWAGALGAAGVPLACRVLESTHPADALIEAAEAEKADLIVAGTRAVGAMRPIRLGGVTMQLLRYSPVPVVVVPPWS